MNDDLLASLKTFYADVCLAPDQERTIASLSDAALRALNGYLELKQVPTGIPALISGLVLCEAAKRFMAQESQPVAGGEA